MANGVLQCSVFILTEWYTKQFPKVWKDTFLFIFFLIHLCIITESCLEKKKKLKAKTYFERTTALSLLKTSLVFKNITSYPTKLFYFSKIRIRERNSTEHHGIGISVPRTQLSFIFMAQATTHVATYNKGIHYDGLGYFY